MNIFLEEEHLLCAQEGGVGVSPEHLLCALELGAGVSLGDSVRGALHSRVPSPLDQSLEVSAPVPRKTHQ